MFCFEFCFAAGGAGGEDDKDLIGMRDPISQDDDDPPHPKSEGKERGETVGQEGEPDVRHTAMLIPEMPSDSAVLHIPL